jgi:hypothetical protein
MTPRERKMIRRIMIVASALVALMMAIMLWSAFRSEPKPPASGQPNPVGGP